MTPARVTLDTNCLINLERRTCQYRSVRALVDAHRAGRLIVCATAMAASENQRGGSKRSSYEEFEDWLMTLDASGLEEILPMGYWYVSFWDHAVYSGEQSEAEEEAVHDVLHPELPRRYADFCEQHGLDPAAKPTNRRWLNAKCDVQAMWSHIHAGNHVFVTEDKRFLTPARRSALIALGAGDILTPDDAMAKLLDDSSTAQL